MSFWDSLAVTVLFFLFIIMALIGVYLWLQVSPSLPSANNNNITSQFNTSINTTVSFWNNDFAAIYVIIMLGSVILTVFLRSNPALLVIWIIFNACVLFVWDQLNVVLNIFINSSLNGGQMAIAVGFFQGPLAQVIVIMNILIGIFLFGKNIFSGGSSGGPR